jgi:phage shock protein C
MTTYCSRNERGVLYRSRNGMIFGVFRGLADHLNISAFWLRVPAVFFLVTSFGWALGAYFLAALIMRLEPTSPEAQVRHDTACHDEGADSTRALQRIKRSFDRLSNRIERMESVVTSRERDWERRLNS